MLIYPSLGQSSFPHRVGIKFRVLNPQLVAENQAVLIEAFNNYAMVKHGTAVVHAWPNIMITLSELQINTAQIF